MNTPSFVIPITLCALTATPAAAQTYTYSPASAATTANFGNNTLPFWVQAGQPLYRRYQQVHSDLKGQAQVLTGMQLRPGGTPATQGARTVEMALLLADADLSKTTTTFNSNYLITPVTKITRKTIAFPDLNTKGWTIDLPFDSLHVYQGVTDFLWEANIYAITVPSTGSPVYFLDSYGHTPFGTSTNYGTACTATGQTNAVRPNLNCVTRANDQMFIYNFRFFYGAASQPAGIAIGAKRTDVNVPGWCSNVYTDPLMYLMGGTDSNGTFNTPTVEIPYQKSLANIVFNFQCYSQDPVLAIALSDGVEYTTPSMPTTGVAMRIWGDLNQATGSTDTFGNNGLVARFQQ